MCTIISSSSILIPKTKLNAFNRKIVQEKGTSVMQCPECEYQLKDHRELVKHFDDFHADRAGAYTIESRTFTDYTSFKVWKEKLEEECVTRFATISRNIGQECTITYFRVRNEKEKFAWSSVGNIEDTNRSLPFLQWTPHLKPTLCRF
ncbi:hypothetical protein RB195_009840 [Necator americanus]|uniref:C2H2-type domain-containing protein n=1 Tax=Necator americanus TaxID=51031 RepID=A0ABR1CV60_NECAM